MAITYLWLCFPIFRDVYIFSYESFCILTNPSLSFPVTINYKYHKNPRKTINYLITQKIWQTNKKPADKK